MDRVVLNAMTIQAKAHLFFSIVFGEADPPFIRNGIIGAN
jgi:hypothetical protein